MDNNMNNTKYPLWKTETGLMRTCYAKPRCENKHNNCAKDLRSFRQHHMPRRTEKQKEENRRCVSLNTQLVSESRCKHFEDFVTLNARLGR